MSASKKNKILILFMFLFFLYSNLYVRAQISIPPSLTMEATLPCSGSNHLIKFVAGGPCTAYPLQWNAVGPNFIETDAENNWIEGYFSTSGTKTIGFYYHAAYEGGGCKSTSDYYENTFNIEESNPSVGTISGNTTLCSGSQASLSVSSVKGNILGWEKKLPEQDWSQATIINKTSRSISSPDIDNETMDYRIMVGSVCAATVYQEATITYIDPDKPEINNPPGECGNYPTISVSSSADPSSSVIHEWFYAGQSTPFHSDPAIYKGYGNNIFQSTYTPTQYRNYDIASLVDGCPSPKVTITVGYNTPTPPPTNIIFFVNSKDASTHSVNACKGETVSVTASGTDLISFHWYYPDGSNMGTGNQVNIDCSKLSQGTNTITVVATFKNECGSTTTLTDYFKVNVTVPGLTISNSDPDDKYCGNEKVNLKSSVNPSDPSEASYAWYLNNSKASSLQNFNSSLDPDVYQVYSTLNANFSDCLTKQSLKSNSLTFKVFQKPEAPGGGDALQVCQGQEASFSASNILPSGYTVEYEWVNTNDMTTKYLPAGHPGNSQTIYDSEYKPDIVPVNGTVFQVSALVEDGSFTCRGTPVDEKYKINLKPPPPASLSFNTKDSGEGNDFTICKDDTIGISISTPFIVQADWYQSNNDIGSGKNMKFSYNKTGDYYYVVNASYNNGCGAIQINSSLTIHVTAPAAYIDQMDALNCEGSDLNYQMSYDPNPAKIISKQWFFDDSDQGHSTPNTNGLNSKVHSVYAVVSADYDQCSTTQKVVTNSMSFTVLPTPPAPEVTDITPDCSGDFPVFTTTTKMEAGYTLSHQWYLGSTGKSEGSEPAVFDIDHYSSTFSKKLDNYPDTLKVYSLVNNKCISKTYSSVQYIKHDPPDLPDHFDFYFNGSSASLKLYDACDDQDVHIVVDGGNKVDDFKWYRPDGSLINVTSISSMDINSADLDNGDNYFTVKATFNACNRITIPIQDQFDIDLHNPEIPEIKPVENKCNKTIISKTESNKENWYWETDPKHPDLNNNDSQISVSEDGSVYIMSYDGYCWSMPNEIIVKVNKSPDLSLSGTTSICDQSFTTLQASAPDAATIIWYDGNDGDILKYSDVYQTPLIVQDMKYHVAAFSSSGCVTEKDITVNVYPPDKQLPQIPYLTKSGNDYSLNINNTNSDEFSYYWLEAPESADILNDDEVIPASYGKDYYVRALDKNGCWGPPVSIRVPDLFPKDWSAPVSGSQVNVIKNLTFKKIDIPDNSTNPDELEETLSYFDGLGRPIQVVKRKGSTGEKDIVRVTKYNKLGMSPWKFKPYSAVSTDGSFQAEPISDLTNFYQTNSKISNTAFPFAYQLYDDSPLNRAIESGGAGESWAGTIGTLNSKTLRKHYDVNTADDKIIIWDKNNNNLVTDGYYPAGALLKNINVDENGNSSFEFVNKKGQTVLKRAQLESDGTDWADTYYVYDSKENLQFVIQPEAVKEMLNSRNDYISTDGNADEAPANMVFQYKYDERNRMVAKLVPGSGWIYYVYDPWNRLVFTQDGNEREKREWEFIKYDQFNRPVMTGIKTLSMNSDDLKRELYNSNSSRYEKKNGGSIGYTTSQSYPSVNVSDIQTVTYYDDYDFPDQSDNNFGFLSELGIYDYNHQVTGKVTGKLTKIINEDTWLESRIYYDDRYHVIQTVADNQCKGTDRVTSIVDKLTGDVLETRTSHENPKSDNTINTLSKIYTYDHNNRIKSISLAIAKNVTWADLENAVSENGTLTGGYYSHGRGPGADSEEKINKNSDGWMEFTVNDEDQTEVIG